MLTKENISKFKELISTKGNIVVVSHKSPDGDAIGSSLSLYNYLIQFGHSVSVIVPDYFPDYLKWTKGSDKILRHDKDLNIVKEKIDSCDLLICVDFNNLGRIEKLGELVEESSAKKVLIDHHPNPQNFADLIISETRAGATAELLCDILFDIDDSKYINKAVAECLYLGMLTDTGSFNNPATTANILKHAASLQKIGVSHEDIVNDVYNNYSEDRMRLVGNCLSNRLKVLHKDKAAYIYITKDDLKKYNFQVGDSEGVVNIPLGIKDIAISALFTEFDNYIRVSLRSIGDVDVNKLSGEFFNGGGHVNASGGKSFVNMEETLAIFEKAVSGYVK